MTERHAGITALGTLLGGVGALVVALIALGVLSPGEERDETADTGAIVTPRTTDTTSRTTEPPLQTSSDYSASTRRSFLDGCIFTSGDSAGCERALRCVESEVSEVEYLRLESALVTGIGDVSGAEELLFRCGTEAFG